MKYVSNDDMPTPKYRENPQRLLSYYDKAYNEMEKRFLKQFEKATSPEEYSKCLATSEILLDYEMSSNRLNKSVAQEIIKLTTNAFMNGMDSFEFFLNAFLSIEKVKKEKKEVKLPNRMIEAMANDTFQELLQATKHMTNSMKKAVRDTVSDVIRYHQALNDGREAMVQDIFNRLSKQGLSKTLKDNGFVGIVDKAGKRWNLKTYAEMVSTTKISQAHTQATKYEGEQYGIDLAIISHPSCKDSCNKWKDVIVSINGKTKGFITYDEARKTKEVFHPNCHGTLIPVRKLSLIHPDILKENLKKDAPNKNAIEEKLKLEKLQEEEKRKKREQMKANKD